MQNILTNRITFIYSPLMLFALKPELTCPSLVHFLARVLIRPLLEADLYSQPSADAALGFDTKNGFHGDSNVLSQLVLLHMTVFPVLHTVDLNARTN